MADQEIVHFELKRIPNIIEKAYRVISVENTDVIFYTCTHFFWKTMAFLHREFYESNFGEFKLCSISSKILGWQSPSWP